MSSDPSHRILYARPFLVPAAADQIGRSLSTIQPEEIPPGSLALVIDQHAIYEWRADSVAAVSLPLVVAAAKGTTVAGRWHQCGLFPLDGSFAGQGWDLRGLPLHNYYDDDSGSTALAAGVAWVELWSLLGTSFLADTMVRRLGVSCTFEADAASLKDDEQVLFTVERTGATYTMCDKTNRTAASSASVTGSFTGQANGLTLNWRLRNDAGTLRFEVQQDAGAARHAHGRFWYGEPK